MALHGGHSRRSRAYRSRGRYGARVLDVGIVGFGAIGQVVARELAAGTACRVASILVRPTARPEFPEGTVPGTSVDELLASELSLVAECAGQGAVRQYGEQILAAGVDLMIISTGALADEATYERLQAAARAGGSRMLLPAGATAGMDGLSALRAGGLTRVRYTSTKPPGAWKGTEAEQLIELDALTEPTVFYEGPAREAAQSFPKNANLAATIALAGIGLDKTEIALVANPAASGNRGRIEAEGLLGGLTVETWGEPSETNPKTSAVTAFSIVAAVESRQAAVALPA